MKLKGIDPNDVTYFFEMITLIACVLTLVFIALRYR